VLNNYLDKGYFENIKVQWVGGAAPGASFFDKNGGLIEELPLGADFNVNELTSFLHQHGFALRRPVLVDTVLTSEFDLGEKHYQYFGPGKKFGTEVDEFAASKSWNGKKGRLVTFQCKEQEDKVNEWIKSVTSDEVEAWIGADDATHEAHWRWHLENGETEVFWIEGTDHNADPHYSNWRNYEPNNAGRNEQCATSVVGSGWNDVHCDSAAQVIIEFGPSKSSECESPVTNTVHSEVDL